MKKRILISISLFLALQNLLAQPIQTTVTFCDRQYTIIATIKHSLVGHEYYELSITAPVILPQPATAGHPAIPHQNAIHHTIFLGYKNNATSKDKILNKASDTLQHFDLYNNCDGGSILTYAVAEFRDKLEAAWFSETPQLIFKDELDMYNILKLTKGRRYEISLISRGKPPVPIVIYNTNNKRYELQSATINTSDILKKNIDKIADDINRITSTDFGLKLTIYLDRNKDESANVVSSYDGSTIDNSIPSFSILREIAKQFFTNTAIKLVIDHGGGNLEDVYVFPISLPKPKVNPTYNLRQQ